MKYKFIAAALFLGAGLLSSSCKDDFADLNSKPEDVTKPDIRFLFTSCLTEVEPMDYSAWFYDFNRVANWSQATVTRGGNSSTFNLITEQGSIGYQVNRLLRMVNEVRYQVSLMSPEEKAKNEYIQYLCNPLLVYVGMYDSDAYGSRQYSQAEQARYTNPPLLKPEYDTQEQLFDFWLKELDETITYLTTHKISSDLGGQDFIYHGDLTKWAKLANSMKLKLAARLINVDKERAIKIANEVAKSPAGVLSELSDDFVFNKGKNDDHWHNDISASMNIGSKQLIDFLVANRDPRLRVIFQKNDFSSKVVQAFIDQKKQLPPYIEANVVTEVNADGKTVFKEWKGPGEPWVRYYGVPLEIGASKVEDNKWYFNPDGTLFTLLTADKSKKTYKPLAYRNEEIVRGMQDYNYPVAPDEKPEQDLDDWGWYGLYCSAGEVNLLLAEFKLLGAELPNSAQDYLTAGVTLSTQAFDNIAAKNHIPYYDKVSSDKFDKSIKLQDGEIETMLAHDPYILNGTLAENLEKVYLQQYIHYLMSPIDQFVTVRRSGVPMKNSTIYKWQEFDAQTDYTSLIPRRFKVSEPTKSDILYDITIGAYNAQGYTYGNGNDVPATLNSERVWYDKNAPQFGEGPKL